MKKLIVLVACGLLGGCDYTVPLVTAPVVDIDKRLVGLWERATGTHETEQVLVLPLNKREYMIAFPLGKEHGMFAKACITAGAGTSLVQLEWIGTVEGKLPEDDRIYQVAAYSVNGDELSVRMLNTSVVSKTVKTSDELAKAIEDNKNRPGLFGDPMVFQKAKKKP